MLFDTADTMIKRFDAVMELRVGQFQERAQFSKFSIHVFAVFGMPAIEMHLKSLGNRLDIVAKPFNQHTGMTLDVLSARFRGLAECTHVSTEFHRRCFRGLTQRSHVLAQAFGDRCHDPFNL